jgi:hypothetical protein
MFCCTLKAKVMPNPNHNSNYLKLLQIMNLPRGHIQPGSCSYVDKSNISNPGRFITYRYVSILIGSWKMLQTVVLYYTLELICGGCEKRRVTRPMESGTGTQNGQISWKRMKRPLQATATRAYGAAEPTRHDKPEPKTEPGHLRPPGKWTVSIVNYFRNRSVAMCQSIKSRQAGQKNANLRSAHARPVE